MPPISQIGNSKLAYRMQLICKYRVVGKLTDKKIAELVGLSPAGLSKILTDPDYMEMEEAAQEGRLSDIERTLSEDEEALRKGFREAVPAALTALVETVVQRRDLRSRLAAAKEILDRDPDAQFLAKSGKSGDVGNGTNAPALPSDIVASLAVEGNKAVASIKSRQTTIVVQTTDTVPPEAGLHNA